MAKPSRVLACHSRHISRTFPLFAMSVLPLNKSQYEVLVTQSKFRMDDPAIRQFLDDQAFMLAAVSKNGFRLQHASARLKGHHAVVSAAVAQKGLALWCVSPTLRDDRAIVTHAVTQDGTALKYASVALRSDPAVVLTAVAQEGRSLQFAEPSLRDGGLKAYVISELVAFEGFRSFLLATRVRRSKALPEDAMDISSSKLRGAAPEDEVAAARLEKLGDEAGLHVKGLVAEYVGSAAILDPKLRLALNRAAQNLGLSGENFPLVKPQQ